jgi:SAM-dependent methyltransferase
MSDAQHVDRQRRFYDTRQHGHLQAQREDYYARKLASELARELGVGPRHRVLELGAGFGRFTFHLLDFCDSLLAVDLSEIALEKLDVQRAEWGIERERCQTLCGDLADLTLETLGERFDFVVGFFLLHHLPDFARSIQTLAPLLAPGGRIAFLEPNRRNPLFLVQVAACPDMTWAEEKGMFSLSQKGVEDAYRAASLDDIQTRTLGFFPPQILNRFERARRLEARLEKARSLRWILPFLLLSAQVAGEDEAGP